MSVIAGEQTGRPAWKRWLRRIGGVLLLALVSIVGRSIYTHHKVTARLIEAIEEQDRDEPGWRIEEIEAARAHVPDADNGAEMVLAAAKLLPRGWQESSHVAELNRTPHNLRLPDNLAKHVGEELQQLQAAIAAARKLAGRETGRYAIQYTPDYISTLLPHANQVRQVSALLCLDGIDRAQRDDVSGALSSCHASINAARSFGDEPLSISLLVRISCCRNAVTALERVLNQGVPAGKDLEAIQRLLEKEDNEPGLERAARCERAFLHGVFEAVESGITSLDELAGQGKPGAWGRLTAFHVQDQLRANHPLIFTLFAQQLRIARLPMHERGAAQQEHDAHVRSLERSPVKLLMPALGKVERADRGHHSSLRCAVAALAAERYRLKHLSWPASVEQLREFAGIPLNDPLDGKPLRIRRLEDGLVIYSIGLDKQRIRDLPPQAAERRSTDGEFRLWDVQHRRRQPSVQKE